MTTLGITIVARAKHRELFAAAKKLGGVGLLSKHLGVQVTTLYLWIGLRKAPPADPTDTWPQSRLDALETKLIDLTGKSLDQLFPDEMRDRQWLKRSKTVEIHRDVEVSALLGEQAPRFLLPSPHEVLEQEDLSEQIKAAMQSLSWRERKVLEMRFGLDGNPSMTLEQCGIELKVTQERIRQIESKAIRKLQNPKLASLLVD